MIILPAIDIKDGNCVRLFKGDFATVEKVADSPLETAISFVECGAKWIHMVDLDGALHGNRQNANIFTLIAKETPLNVELGGGIRTMNDIDFYINKGVSRIILGSVAIKNPSIVKEAVKEFGEKIAVGIDAKNGYVASEGWLENSNVNFIDLAKSMEDVGVKNIIYTDISKDGTLAGPNIEHLVQINKEVSCEITASGGIANSEDIVSLRDKNLYGAICGKSIYKGTLSLKVAIDLCK